MTCLYTTGSWSGCCPEEVPVTITNNYVEIDGSTLLSYAGVLSVSGTTLQLPQVPMYPAQLGIVVDGAVYRYGVDFTVSGTGLVTFGAAVVSSNVYVTFMYLSGASGLVSAASGSSVIWFGDVEDVPSGYLLLDGGALTGEGAGLGYKQADYATLYAVIGSTLGVGVNGDGDPTFLTTPVQNAFYVEGALTTKYSIIKE